MRNAILPVVTYVGPMIAMVVTGSFVIEKVFGIPGIGSLFTSSVLTRDYTLIMALRCSFRCFWCFVHWWLIFCTSLLIQDQV